jgi:hypothetical protein
LQVYYISWFRTTSLLPQTPRFHSITTHYAANTPFHSIKSAPSLFNSAGTRQGPLQIVQQILERRFRRVLHSASNRSRRLDLAMGALIHEQLGRVVARLLQDNAPDMVDVVLVAEGGFAVL